MDRCLLLAKRTNKDIIHFSQHMYVYVRGCPRHGRNKERFRESPSALDPTPRSIVSRAGVPVVPVNLAQYVVGEHGIAVRRPLQGRESCPFPLPSSCPYFYASFLQSVPGESPPACAFPPFPALVPCEGHRGRIRKAHLFAIRCVPSWPRGGRFPARPSPTPSGSPADFGRPPTFRCYPLCFPSHWIQWM